MRLFRAAFCGFFGVMMGNVAEAQGVPEIRQLDSIRVTGSRVPATLGRSARMVTVLDSLSLACVPAESVNDLLKVAVGTDVRQRGAGGIQTDFSVRGGTFDQVAVLLNGINVCDPETGHLSVDFPVDQSEIDRIEILEGPAARVYGTSALVGAVNVVTVPSAFSGGAVRLEGGSHGLFQGSGRLSLVKGRLSNQLSAGWLRSDGNSRNRAGRLNADVRKWRAFWQGGWGNERVDLRWHAGLCSRDFGANTFYSAKFDDQFEHTFKSWTALQAETKGRVRMRAAAYWNHSKDRFELIRGSEALVPFNHHRTRVLGLNLGAWTETKLGKTAFGGELRNEDILSTNLGEPLSKPVGKHYRCGLDRTRMNLYLDHSLVLRRFTMSAGAIAARHAGHGPAFGIYPGVDASLRLGDHLRLYGSWNTSLRLPTFTELYYSVGGHKADPKLRPEKMQAFEAGLKYYARGIRAVATVYYHRGSDLIDWIRDVSKGEDEPWKSVNYAQVNTLGEELTLRFDLPVFLDRRDFFLRSVNLGWSHIDQDKERKKDIQSRYALEYLRNKLVGEAEMRLARNLSFYAGVSWLDRRGSYEVFKDGASTGRTASYKPYVLLDVRLSWSNRFCRLFLEGNNLLNLTYYDFGNIPQRGLALRAGLVKDFRF